MAKTAVEVMGLLGKPHFKNVVDTKTYIFTYYTL